MSKFSFVDKLNLARLPTPIEKLQKLSLQASASGGVEIFVKRDDLTDSVAAGNKIRKLELHFAEARRRGARVIFTCGAVQSNHARATAVLSRRLGFECVLFLRKVEEVKRVTGNHLLDLMFGADIRFISEAEFGQINKLFFESVEFFRKRDGVSPYIIPEGGSDEIGGLAYALAFEEIVQQGLVFDSVVVANGSGGTQAGLILGKSLFGSDNTRIIGVNVCRTGPEMAEKTKQVALSTIQRHRLPISFMPADIHMIDGYVAPGYGKASAELNHFIVQACRADGILLDPVYTGKALYAVVSELRRGGGFASLFGKRILFIHTGGFPSIFAYEEQLYETIKNS